MVLYWSPATIRWTAASSASLPVTGGTGVDAGGLEGGDGAAAGAVVGRDDARRSGRRNWVIWPLTQSWAFGGSQSGVSNSASSLQPLGSTAAWMPFLISPAAASVGDPLTCSSPPSAPSSALSLSTSDWAIISPIASLSKET